MKKEINFILILNSSGNIDVSILNDRFPEISNLKSHMETKGYLVYIHVINNNYDNVSLPLEQQFFACFFVNAENINETLTKARNLKQINPLLHISLYGPITNTIEHSILSDNECVDSILLYESGNTFEALIKCLEQSCEPNEVAGIVYKNSKGKIIINYYKESDIEANILHPSRLPSKIYNKDYLDIRGSIGCLGACSFCASVHNYTKILKVCLRNAESIVNEIQNLMKEYKINTFRLLDSTFEDPGEEGFNRANKIFDLIIERGIKVHLHLFTRTNLVLKEPEDYFRKAKMAGVECFYVGIESGNNDDLKLYNKGCTVSDNMIAIEKIQKAGIYVSMGFISFNPYTTYQRLLQNAEFINSSHMGHIYYFYQSRVAVYPQSRMLAKLQKDGLVDGFSYRSHRHDYRFQNPLKLFIML